jgi:hypothetical protein
MVTNDSPVAVSNRRRPARDLIAAVVENMRSNLETLKYSTLAPSRYVVYVHPVEYARLESIIPILQEETVRALTEELDRLNNPSGLRRYSSRLKGESAPRVQTPSGDWQVEFVMDPDGELAEGDILIDSELMLPAQPELGVGQRTRRITTAHQRQGSGGQVAEPGPAVEPTRESAPLETPAAAVTPRSTVGPAEDRTVRTQTPPPPRAFARLVYEDKGGRHTFDVTSDSILIGRGSTTASVDVRIESSVDVSREHARIRRDPATAQFFLIDLSTLGTTLNGRHVPRGYDEVDGVRRETGVETPLPNGARIGLADTVFLEFTVGDNPAKAGLHNPAEAGHHNPAKAGHYNPAKAGLHT